MNCISSFLLYDGAFGNGFLFYRILFWMFRNILNEIDFLFWNFEGVQRGHLAREKNLTKSPLVCVTTSLASGIGVQVGLGGGQSAAVGHFGATSCRMKFGRCAWKTIATLIIIKFLIFDKTFYFIVRQRKVLWIGKRVRVCPRWGPIGSGRTWWHFYSVPSTLDQLKNKILIILN